MMVNVDEEFALPDGQAQGAQAVERGAIDCDDQVEGLRAAGFLQDFVCVYGIYLLVRLVVRPYF